MTQVKMILDSDDPIDMELEKINSIKEATAPDGHKYVQINYDGNPEKKSKFYAIKGTLTEVKKILHK
jgi:hypothetical protein